MPHLKAGKQHSMTAQRHILEQLAMLREYLFNSPLNILWSESPYTIKIHIKKSLVKLNMSEQSAPTNPNSCNSNPNSCDSGPNSCNSLIGCASCEHLSSALRQAEHELRESQRLIEPLEVAQLEAAERINALASN